MLWTTGLLLLFISTVLGSADLRLLKKEWKHENYTSFDHFWNEEWADNDTARPMTEVMKAVEEARIVCKLQHACPIAKPSIIGERTNCVNGNAGGYECDGIDMLAFVSLQALGSSSSADGNDIWGYTAGDGRMYALTGQTDGSSIVDVTDPENPEVLVFIPSETTQNTVWRDIKVYQNYAYIVADRSGSGLQYVNLDELITAGRAASGIYVAQSSDIGVSNAIGNCHNIVINADAGFAYAVGANVASGGLYKWNLAGVSSGNAPIFDGQYSADGYTHDANCVTYNGPDAQYVGREICFAYNENSITIVDMTNGNAPVQLSRTTYANSAYTHQGWITDNHQYLLMNDELDESRFGYNTRTYVFDVTSLSNPGPLTFYTGPTAAIDHNLYIEGNVAYEANYRAGLRIIDISNIANGGPSLDQTAYFKTYTGTITASFNGAWSVYPYFSNPGNEFVVVQDIEQGLFILSKP